MDGGVRVRVGQGFIQDFTCTCMLGEGGKQALKEESLLGGSAGMPHTPEFYYYGLQNSAD